MTLVPSFTFDSDTLPVHEAFALWSKAHQTSDLSFPEGEGVEGFAVRHTAWMLGDFTLVKGFLSPLEMRRSREHLRRDGRDDICLVYLSRGSWQGETDRATMSAGPGQLALQDLSREWFISSTATEHIIINIGRAPAGHLLPDLSSLHGRVLEGVAAQLLVDFICSLTGHLPRLALSEAPGVTRAFVGLLSACAASQIEPQESRSDAVLTYRIRTYVDQHLLDAPLTVPQICADLGVSRANLYRACKPLGGFVAHVQRRRLEAARACLSDPAEARSLAQIAQCYGFSDGAQFSRAFRQRFGQSPRAFRPGGKAWTGQGSDGEARFRHWLATIGSAADLVLDQPRWIGDRRPSQKEF